MDAPISRDGSFYVASYNVGTNINDFALKDPYLMQLQIPTRQEEDKAEVFDAEKKGHSDVNFHFHSFNSSLISQVRNGINYEGADKRLKTMRGAVGGEVKTLKETIAKLDTSDLSPAEKRDVKKRLNRTIKSAQHFLDKTKKLEVNERTFPSVCKQVKSVLDDFDKTFGEIDRSREGKRGSVLQDFYKDVTRTVVSRLKTQNKKQAIVYSLQEVHSAKDNAIVKALKQSNFEVVHVGHESLDALAASNIKHDHLKRMDTAVAVPKKVFKDIENRSFKFESGGKECDVAVAVATHRRTNQKFAFVSAHIQGFDIVRVANAINELATCEDDARKAQLQADLQYLPSDGTEQLKTMIDGLIGLRAEVGEIIIGADTNAPPNLLQDRAKILTDRGVAVNRTGQNTARRAHDNANADREIDYFMRFKPFHKNIRTTPISNPTQKGLYAPGFGVKENASDHTLVYLKVDVIKDKTLKRPKENPTIGGARLLGRIIKPQSSTD